MNPSTITKSLFAVVLLLTAIISPAPLWKPKALKFFDEVVSETASEKEEDLREIKLIDNWNERMVRRYNHGWIKETLAYIQNPELKKQREALLNKNIMQEIINARQVNQNRQKAKEFTDVVDHNIGTANANDPVFTEEQLHRGGHGARFLRDNKKEEGNLAHESLEDAAIQNQHMWDLLGARTDDEEAKEWLEKKVIGREDPEDDPQNCK